MLDPKAFGRFMGAIVVTAVTFGVAALVVVVVLWAIRTMLGGC